MNKKPLVKLWNSKRPHCQLSICEGQRKEATSRDILAIPGIQKYYRLSLSQKGGKCNSKLQSLKLGYLLILNEVQQFFLSITEFVYGDKIGITSQIRLQQRTTCYAHICNPSQKVAVLPQWRRHLDSTAHSMMTYQVCTQVNIAH